MTDVEYQDILVLQLHAMETLLWPMRNDSKAKQERERLKLNSEPVSVSSMLGIAPSWHLPSVTQESPPTRIETVVLVGEWRKR